MEQQAVKFNADSLDVFKQHVIQAESTFQALPGQDKNEASLFFNEVGERLKQAVAAIVNEKYGEARIVAVANAIVDAVANSTTPDAESVSEPAASDVEAVLTGTVPDSSEVKPVSSEMGVDGPWVEAVAEPAVIEDAIASEVESVALETAAVAAAAAADHPQVALQATTSDDESDAEGTEESAPVAMEMMEQEVAMDTEKNVPEVEPVAMDAARSAPEVEPVAMEAAKSPAEVEPVAMETTKSVPELEPDTMETAREVEPVAVETAPEVEPVAVGTAPEVEPVAMDAAKSPVKVGPLAMETVKSAPEVEPVAMEAAPEVEPVAVDTAKSPPEVEPVAVDTTKSAPEDEPVTMETKTQEAVPVYVDIANSVPPLKDSLAEAAPASESEITQTSSVATSDVPQAVPDAQSVDAEIPPPSSPEEMAEDVEESSSVAAMDTSVPDKTDKEQATNDDLKQVLSEKEREIQCLKECLWKIAHPTVEEPPETNSEEIVSCIVNELVDKVVFLRETHNSLELLETVVDIDLAVQNYPTLKRPQKRKRGRPPKNTPSKAPYVPKLKRARPEIEIDQSIVKVEPRGPWEDGTDPTVDEFDEDGIPMRSTRLRRRSRLQSKEDSDPLKEELGKALFNRIISDDDDMESGPGETEVPMLSDLDDTDFDPGAVDLDDEEEAKPRRRRKPGRPRKAASYVTSPRGPHKRVVRHTCQLCNKLFFHGRPFNRHLLGHGKAKCCCKKCRREFFNYAVLLDHACLRPKLRSKERPCPICSTVFTNIKTLHRHMKDVHDVKRFETLPFNCKFCEKAFSKRSLMYTHYSEHSEGKLVCLKCGRFYSDQQTLDSHIHDDHTQEEGEYSCDACGAGFTRRQQYGVHVQGQRKNQCIICDQHFCTKKLLDYHNKQAHGIKTMDPVILKYTCETCGKMFQRPGQLDIHTRIHTGEKPIECSVCKIHFRTTKALRKHQMTRTHMTRSGETRKGRDFLCSLCGKTYLRKDALDRHTGRHSNQTAATCEMAPKDRPEKPFACPHCGRAFKSKYNMEHHAILHFSQRNFVCEECGAAFHARRTLESHMAHMHSDRRDFLCTECPLTFKTSKSLKGHLLIHRARTHKCMHCGKFFNRQNNLRRHMRKMHNTEEGLPPPKTVRLLDVPPGMELHKGSVAYYAARPKNPEAAPKKPRRRKPKVANPIDMEKPKAPMLDPQYTEAMMGAAAAAAASGYRYLDVDTSNDNNTEPNRAAYHLPMGIPNTGDPGMETVPSSLIGPYALAVQALEQQNNTEGYILPSAVNHPAHFPVVPGGVYQSMPPAAHSGANTTRYVPRPDQQM